MWVLYETTLHFTHLPSKVDMSRMIFLFKKMNNFKSIIKSDYVSCLTGASSFSEAMKIGTEVYHNLKAVIKKKYGQDGENPFFMYVIKMYAILAAAL